ncbi:MAG: hypothetical protein WD313_01690 [Acidimicrobiia bacterium]
MGQQPNVEIDPSDLPRPTPETDPPRRWRPTRPGVIVSPDQMPWGGAFGTPGPDTGWALKLVRAADLPERTDGLESVLAALMAARSSLFGRAPVPEDLEVAMILAGFGEGLPAGFSERRGRWIEATAHEPSPGQMAVSDIERDLLELKPDQIKRRLRIIGA